MDQPDITTITVRRSAYDAAQALAGADGITNSVDIAQDLRDSCWQNGNSEAAHFWSEVYALAQASLCPDLYQVSIRD